MSYWSGSYHDWAPRKTAAERRADAARAIRDAARRGRAMSPVAITGRKIAQTFWGKAWCDNLERYRDFAYRLERGRSYLRSGSVIDLQIEAGKITAKVSGSSLYDVAIEIDTVKRDAWGAIQRDCAGSIGSRIDLLSGVLSQAVMARLCADRTGLFPHPSAIRFTCSCPDYATMCKHVAAAMYGVGARLDHAPDLLFTLRRVSLDELVASAVTELPATPSTGRVLAAEGLAALFGLELAEAPAQPDTRAAPRAAAEPSRTAGARPRRATRPAASPRPATPPAASLARRSGASARRTALAKPNPTRAPASAKTPASRDSGLDALITELASAWGLPARRTKITRTKTATLASKIASGEKQRASVARTAAPRPKRLASSASQPATPARKSAPAAKQPSPRVRDRLK
jgi:uncharacterized Zn finger protein